MFLVTPITIAQYFAAYAHGLLIDVRSPGEFQHAHIPGALSLPLFSDEERRVVGTAYKQESREKAIKIGLKYFGPKMVKMVEQVEKWKQERLAATGTGGIAPGQAPDAAAAEFPVVVHCWRGGMRSAGVAWLLDLYGFRVYTIIGGYKSFRHFCLRQFEHDYPFHLVGGYTGSGKTGLLHHLRQQHEQVIDLEGLASHKGSAFGNINMPPQPSQEMFENRLAMALYRASHSQPLQRLWLEDESQRIGDLNIPFAFYKKMRQSPLFFLDIPFEERLSYLVKDYGKGDIEKLVNAIIRIQKRLGGMEAKQAIQHLMDHDIRSAFAILLRYYDKWYLKGMDQHRENLAQLLRRLPLPTTDGAANAAAIVSFLASGQTDSASAH
ncbi:MAG: tRNA 2-selenouridine(34) synthase MnmH [Chitinophagaceae bacterium]|nr:tRNA 2-selenouridine(34) synthase MnmH [Chitinophagaceae bacterium]